MSHLLPFMVCVCFRVTIIWGPGEEAEMRSVSVCVWGGVGSSYAAFLWCLDWAEVKETEATINDPGEPVLNSAKIKMAPVQQSPVILGGISGRVCVCWGGGQRKLVRGQVGAPTHWCPR